MKFENRSLAPKITSNDFQEGAVFGHFEAVGSRFSKGKWESKLFGMRNGIVQRGFGRLNLNLGS